MPEVLVESSNALAQKDASSMNTKPAKTKKDHPTYLKMIIEAIRHFKEQKGSSRPAIYKYIQTTYNIDRRLVQIRGNIAIRNGLKDGHLKTGKTTSSFKVGDKQKEEEKAKEKLLKEKAKKELAKKKEIEKIEAKKAKTKKTSIAKSANKSVLQKVKERAAAASKAKKVVSSKTIAKEKSEKEKKTSEKNNSEKKSPKRKANDASKSEVKSKKLKSITKAIDAKQPKTVSSKPKSDKKTNTK